MFILVARDEKKSPPDTAKIALEVTERVSAGANGDLGQMAQCPRDPLAHTPPTTTGYRGAQPGKPEVATRAKPKYRRKNRPGIPGLTA
ncbi:hypothetical protein ACFWY9_14155 [Amycolatopsis sp. NPDC059027]|uniref:hypothetical protein n=1 Tax=unclassified Amycolatopsis TaxID=2618356 RepID=UPI003672DB9D